jgi:hypothetical protein
LAQGNTKEVPRIRTRSDPELAQMVIGVFVRQNAVRPARQSAEDRMRGPVPPSALAHETRHRMVQARDFIAPLARNAGHQLRGRRHVLRYRDQVHQRVFERRVPQRCALAGSAELPCVEGERIRHVNDHLGARHASPLCAALWRELVYPRGELVVCGWIPQGFHRRLGVCHDFRATAETQRKYRPREKHSGR